MVIIEGMIKKKIILASDVGGIPEIIEDGKTGFLFKSQNKTELIKKLIYIYSNIKDMDHIKENAVSVIKDNFDINKNSGQYYKNYMRKIQNLKIK
ncbi:MAG: glycosyltransferase [Ignavibacteria bacterium]|nr:glycosyltransferase [Ignavibacteria bacterium]